MALINQKPEDIENSLWILKLKIEALENHLSRPEFQTYKNKLYDLKNQATLSESKVKLTFYNDGVKIGI